MNHQKECINNIKLQIDNYKSLINTILYNIQNIHQFDNLDNKYNILINNYYNIIYKSIIHIINLQYKYNIHFYEELIQYFYNPLKVYRFLLNNPDKHVEDM